MSTACFPADFFGVGAGGSLCGGVQLNKFEHCVVRGGRPGLWGGAGGLGSGSRVPSEQV